MQNKSTLLLLALSVAVFGVITTEIAIIGLLPKLVSQLHVTPTQVGFLVSIYAIIVAVTGPFITLMLSGFNKKTVLLSILVVFIVSNLIYATTDVFNLMLVFRILPALAHAVFFAVALVVAANSVPKEKAAGAAAKVFAGVAIGLVLGVPLSSLIAEHFSLSAAFYFGAAACVLAFLGVLFLMPSMPTLHKVSFASQLSVLRNGKLWLTISTVTLIFAAMFSSFSYVADYLSRVTHLNNNYISAMLILFGVCGFAGNFVFSSFLQKNVVKTTLVYPLLFTLLLLLVWFFGFSPLVMCLLTVFWGAFHSSGLVVSQTWLMREASEAPEFANSLYMSFSNLGITLGSLTGGWFIARLGTHSVVLSSVIFTLLAFVSILIKHRSDTKAVPVQEEMA
ncbi:MULTISPECIES: MFS transporter [Enterobacterales]|jgi:predicted MFS family arabinose efflux permease|uniref:MFS transporter n=1 Tax=Enterobacterales TaxID=91347 RepID=UPI00069F07FF|nr:MULTISPECIES: MFS transporter [Enterobacterales]PRB62272.1 MFS transporter [Erwinia billingiae]TBX32289.1 MFS transporter [Rahnella victoriana]TDS98290.1 putative MFS family arabinose efflux permease [Rahnella sp. BIGb0236]VTQ52092.1 transporter, putative [Campylobacter jejuni]